MAEENQDVMGTPDVDSIGTPTEDSSVTTGTGDGIHNEHPANQVKIKLSDGRELTVEELEQRERERDAAVTKKFQQIKRVKEAEQLLEAYDRDPRIQKAISKAMQEVAQGGGYSDGDDGSTTTALPPQVRQELDMVRNMTQQLYIENQKSNIRSQRSYMTEDDFQQIIDLAVQYNNIPLDVAANLYYRDRDVKDAESAALKKIQEAQAKNKTVVRTVTSGGASTLNEAQVREPVTSMEEINAQILRETFGIEP